MSITSPPCVSCSTESTETLALTPPHGHIATDSTCSYLEVVGWCYTEDLAPSYTAVLILLLGPADMGQKSRLDVLDMNA